MPHHHPWYNGLLDSCKSDKRIREQFNMNDIEKCFKYMDRGTYDWTATSGIIPTSSFFSQIRRVYDTIDNSCDNYYWGLIESLFYNNTYYAKNERFFYEFGFYASAALIALKMLIKNCDKENKIPYIFIVTTQSPLELMYTGRSDHINDGLGFYDASSAYTTIFRETIEERKRSSLPLIVERHVLFGEKGGKDIYKNGLNVLENHANDYANHYLKRQINNSDYNVFAEWVKLNHSNIFNNQDNGAENVALYYVVKNDDFPEKTEPTSVNRCIDLIIFGSGQLKPDSDGSNYIDTDWQFGISVIAPIELSQTRFMEVLTKDKLDKTQKLLGFKCYSNFRELVSAFKRRMNQSQRKFYDGIKLGPSRRLIDINPWKNWWKAVEGKSDNNTADKKEGQLQGNVYIEKVEKIMEIKFEDHATMNVGVINDNSIRIEKLIKRTQFEDDTLQEAIPLIKELNKRLKDQPSDDENVANALSQEVLPEIEKGNKANKGKLKEFFLQLPKKVINYGTPILDIANKLLSLWMKF